MRQSKVNMSKEPGGGSSYSQHLEIFKSKQGCVSRLRWWSLTVTSCCPDRAAQGPASSAGVTWRRPVWLGRGRRWKMSRCCRLRSQRTDEGLGELSFSPENLLLVLPFSSHLHQLSALLPHHRPPLVGGKPSSWHLHQELDYQEAVAEVLPLRSWERRDLWRSWNWLLCTCGTPSPHLSSRCPQARTRRESGGHRGPGWSLAWMPDLRCPAFLDSGWSSGSLWRDRMEPVAGKDE